MGQLGQGQMPRTERVQEGGAGRPCLWRLLFPLLIGRAGWAGWGRVPAGAGGGHSIPLQGKSSLVVYLLRWASLPAEGKTWM